MLTLVRNSFGSLAKSRVMRVASPKLGVIPVPYEGERGTGLEQGRFFGIGIGIIKII